VPSKTLIQAAARGAAFPAAMTAVRQAVATIAATETAEVLAAGGIEVVRGHAVFTSPRELSVAGRVLRARRFVIATGSQPATPPVPGLAGARYLTNETVFDLTELPARLAVLGGGAVAANWHRRSPGSAARSRSPSPRPGCCQPPTPKRRRWLTKCFGPRGLA
jgi:pyruvate/2-oxoglutarate dehydrogenase complex dihydrolipoamide dehydrogenase (E3) component